MHNDVYVNLAVPPGTPQSSSLLRISLSAAHSQADVQILIDTFAKMKASQADIMAGMMGRMQAAE
jgi:8-amino-7-oxononanoate synthase